MTEELIISLPEIEGTLIIAGCFHINIEKFPNRFHRFFMRLFLGWRFVKK